MTIASQRVVAAFFCSVLCVSTVRVAEAAYSVPVQKCRAAVAKSGAKLTKSVLKVLAGCHKDRIKGENSLIIDCNDSFQADVDDRLDAVKSKFASSVAARCEGIAPAEADYEGCPVPCDTDVTGMTTFADVATCLVCFDHAYLKLFGNEAWSTPYLGSAPGADGKCHRSITTVSSKMINAMLKSVVGCQADAEAAGATTIDSCTVTQFGSLVQGAYDDAYAKLSTGDCADSEVVLPGALHACGDAATATALATCVLDAAEGFVGDIATKYFELPPTVTTTTTSTTTTTTTTTTLPPSIAACPGSAAIVTDARYSNTCTSNADCGGASTCDDTVGRCATATQFDTGSTGLAHDVDLNDGDVLHVSLSCQGPASPGCGQCGINGVDPGFDNCRCRNSDEICSAFASSSNECPSCVGGALTGSACADNADCSSGSCEPRCANNLDQSCTSNADCPGSSCTTNSRCDNHQICQSNADCTGTCTGAAACDCYVGTPLPLLAAGTPACIVEKLGSNLTGTLNVDSGESQISMHSKLVYYLGASVTRPCPTCSGVCDNAPTACDADSDCDPGHACVFDTPGDGIANGICVAGRRNGLPCDVASSNSSLPARPGEAGGSGYSLDCLPNLGVNVSGTGLDASRVVTTGSVSLSATVPCGFDLSESCACGSCTNHEQTQCTSNSDCSSFANYCTLNPSITCSTNSDCTRRGTCGMHLGIPRCSNDTELSCTSNSDCRFEVSVGNCAASTCSALEASPNSCDDGVCTDLGGNNGECANGPDTEFCDDLLTADGNPLIPCLSNMDCTSFGADFGNCTLSKARSCFNYPVTATGSADPYSPLSVQTYCLAPSSNPGINAVEGLPGPTRKIAQQELTSFCSGNPSVVYTPGGGSCP